MITRDVTIVNKLGLHARAAAKLVTTASGFTSEIKLQKGPQEVNGKSIMGVMMLAAAKGSRIRLKVSGPDEAEAADALEALIRNRFDEQE